MMLTIHGLPSVANYQDVRTLLQRECNLNDFILDNLVNDKNGTKKVRIGVADEMEGAHVIKCLDGFRCGGKVLYVIPVGKQVPPSNQAQAFNPQGNNYPMQSNQYGPPDQVGPWSGQVSDQWAPNVAQVGGYDYSQQNVPFQQQPQHPQRGLNQRELMLQASRGPVQEPYANRPGNVPKQNLGPLASRPALRNIETVDLPKGGPDRFQNYEQPKPITIKKDNFMGPNQFSGNNPQGSYTQGHVQTPWMDQCPQHKQSSYKPSQPYEDDKKFQPKAGILKTPICDREKYNEKPHYSPQRDSPGRRSSPRRNMSPGRRMPPSNDQRMPRDGRAHLDHLSGSNDKMGHNDRRIPMKDDRLGPNDRRIDDRMGSNDRRMPISDRMGPNDRRIPTDDRMGPNDRRMPISDRMGPNDRRMPTDDRMGPNDRRMVPKDDRMVVLNSGRRISPPGRRVSPPGRRISPSGRRISPSRKRMSPTGRRFSPSGRISPSGRLISPGRRDGPMNRHISPPGRRISPPGRHVSPAGRRISSPGRHISPLGRRISPPGRRISPPGRRISPSNKRVSPDRRMRSPVRRSPNRRLSQEPHARSMRYSPGRHPDKDRPKQVRPAYEPDTKAANQAMYSGGYRPNAHEPPTQYRAVVPGAERISPWQDRDNSRDKFAVKKNDDLRRDLIMSKIADEKRISPRASRSPHRRDRSPIRDRYRRHSPSPRSPRRSWALEKRRSPEHDAPPPPAWPGQPQEYPRSNRDKDEKGPVWEKSFVKMEDEFPPDTIRVRKDLMHSGGAHREPSPHRFKQEDRIDDRYREPKFERDDYHDRRFEPDRKKLPDREEFIARSERAHEQLKKKEELPKHQPRLDQYRKKHEQIEEEFQDVYQRAVDFAKKAQELKKHDRKKEPDERRGRDFYDHHQEERPRSRHDEYRKREPEWDVDPRKRMDPNNLAKREKAADEISRRIIQKYIHQVEPEVKNKVINEIKDNIFNKIYETYGDQDISYIECIIKFNTRDARAEERIFHEAASKYSVQYRGMKRPMAAPSEIPSKMARRSPQPEVKQERVRVPRVKRKRPIDSFTPGDQSERRMDDVYITPPAPAPKKFYANKKAGEMFTYELNPLMSRMIDVELQDVMIKVWQSLPDEPRTEADKMVAEKFRTDVGDTFRNVLGLNVAKRLLNIFNKLILKIQFSVIPQRTNLRNFLKKYSFISFKRIAGTTRSFYAQVKSIQDFDWLCKTKDLYCGLSRVSVTPCYKFSQRPDKLKTSFNKSNEEKTKTDVTTDKDAKDTPKNDNIIKQDEKELAKAVAKTTQAESTTQAKPTTSNAENKPTTVKPTTQAKTNVPKPLQNSKESNQSLTAVKANFSANSTVTKTTQVNTTTPTASTTEKMPNKPIQNAPNKPTTATQNAQNKPTTATQNAPNKPTTATQNAPNKTTTAPQNAQNKPTTATQNAQNKPKTATQNSLNKPMTATPNAPNKPKIATQDSPNKSTTATQNAPIKSTTATQNTPNKPITATPNAHKKQLTPQQKKNPSAQNRTTQAKSAPTQTKANANKVKPTPKGQIETAQAKPQAKFTSKAQEIKKKSYVKTKKDPLKGKGDFEELDDHDILALMSGGIVLDECSGSDVE
ncbi:uncharacterized protein LOC128681260 isoform X2 [Plodia interpunctella]|uniref:uncharacterized protein LOC128681260 isoform X2 n=1 Tax=Plodia interpunctella TaxID=58824 RepID=UPI0023678FA5|nr:uncharacterized protein LOC128681260 isoform X2 [Plodia interpunctella]